MFNGGASGGGEAGLSACVKGRCKVERDQIQREDGRRSTFLLRKPVGHFFLAYRTCELGLLSESSPISIKSHWRKVLEQESQQQP